MRVISCWVATLLFATAFAEPVIPAPQRAAAEQFGAEVSRAFNERDRKALAALLDFHALLVRSAEYQGLSGKDEQAFVRAIESVGVDRLSEGYFRGLDAGNGMVKFMRVTDASPPRSLVRIDMGGQGFNYLEFVLRADARANTRSVDWFQLSTGELMSVTLAGANQLFAANNPGLLERLFGGGKVNDTTLANLRQAGDLHRAGKYAEALKLLKQVPEPIASSRFLLTAQASTATLAKLPDEYDRALVKMAAHHADDPAASFMLIDYYYTKKDAAQVLKAINTMERRVGVDGATHQLRSSAYLLANDLPNALKYAEESIRVEPDRLAAYDTRATILVHLGRFRMPSTPTATWKSASDSRSRATFSSGIRCSRSSSPRSRSAPGYRNEPINEPIAVRMVDGTVTANYRALRNAHFRITLRTWCRGLDKALIAAAAALTFMLTAIVTMLVYGLAQALELLTDPALGLMTRVAVVAGWQLVSFVLLRSLREAAFMPKARPYFDTLPIPLADRLRADLVLSMLGYSFLWLPIAWATFDPLDTRTAPTLSTLAILLELVLVSLCLNITLLRAGQGASVTAGALAAFALLGGSGFAWDAARFGCALLAAIALWSSYLPRPAPAARPPRRGTASEKLALSSGLVLPLLGNELKANLLLRVGCIAATLSACLLVMALRTNDTSNASVLVFVAAAATLALYSLPSLSRHTLLTKLEFLAGQPRFARRMRLASYGIPAALFAAALAIASAFDRSARPQVEALVFALLFMLGVIGARLGWQPTSWLMPVFTLITLVILGAMT